MNIQGTIKLIGSTEQVTDKFKKRQVVVTTNDKYPQDLAIDFTQDNVDMLDKFNVGDTVEVGINLRGNEWKGKYYVNINGWKIDANTSDSKEEKGMSKEETDLPF